MVTVAPVVDGLGVTLTAEITGADWLILTTTVCVVTLPALSVAVTMIVFVPLTPVSDFVNDPSLPTVIVPTLVPLSVAVTVTGDDVASLVVPLSVMAVTFCLVPLTGDVRLSVGGMVSILNVVTADS